MDSGNSLGEGYSKIYLLESSEIYGFTSKDVRFMELSDEDDEYAQIYGEPDWENLKGDYGIKLSSS